MPGMHESLNPLAGNPSNVLCRVGLEGARSTANICSRSHLHWKGDRVIPRDVADRAVGIPLQRKHVLGLQQRWKGSVLG